MNSWRRVSLSVKAASRACSSNTLLFMVPVLVAVFWLPPKHSLVGVDIGAYVNIVWYHVGPLKCVFGLFVCMRIKGTLVTQIYGGLFEGSGAAFPPSLPSLLLFPFVALSLLSFFFICSPHPSFLSTCLVLSFLLLIIFISPSSLFLNPLNST